MVYWPRHGRWEEVPIGLPRLAYPTWTRDGRSVCGLEGVANRVECYSFATRRFETVVEIGDDPLLTWIGVPWFGLDWEAP